MRGTIALPRVVHGQWTAEKWSFGSTARSALNT